MKAKTLSVVLMVFLWVGSSAAHQLKSAVTTILFNDRTGNIEVMHRFNLHDAEHAVGELFNKRQADIHTDEKTRALFAVYVLDKFSLATANGTPLELTSVGYQVDGRDFWVYQEAKIPADINGLEVKHSALQELWPDQQNLVNIEGKGEIKSLQFNSDDDELSVRFD
ncbi:hypothetical protein PSI9734_01308 [Pseudidiomarina piscicola]|uniref:Orphan protein n=1 Tax=Pseudidiomarina piscicola TaxID=2614830 RepID=A0A6S6WLL7_9GAMM|nr:DUF6702 family protein [Pseudidiomarina piscicola]CAB0150869.1 hypothetical protein PSI9734_01308 [Pseudidiomarina piscicola]VZT40374.1 hypothetical protein PSI9734_01308 [Pseudomonas aeruginosa]